MSSWAVMLQGSPRGSCPPATRSRAKGGGAGGIRTLDRALQPYNGLANRRLQPLGHSSMSADMPDARASRKRQIQITPRPFGGAGASRAFLTSGRYPISRVSAHVSGLGDPRWHVDGSAIGTAWVTRDLT